ncbi:methyl-accepting chemotaxis protein [Pseudomonas sp. SLBN-26]|nr:methyl-accepting chemotaxis protein [Pseudomonas sp. SLBN-26]
MRTIAFKGADGRPIAWDPMVRMSGVADFVPCSGGMPPDAVFSLSGKKYEMNHEKLPAASLKRLLLSLGTVVALVLVLGNVALWVGTRLLNEADAEQLRLQQATLVFKDVRYHVVQIQQFLTDAAVVGSDDHSEAAAQRQAAHDNLRTLLTFEPSLRSQVDLAHAQVDKLFEVGERMADRYLKEGREAGNQVMKGEGGFDAMSAELASQIEALADQLEQRVVAANQDKHDDLRNLERINVTVGLLALVLLVGGYLFLHRRLIAMLGNEPAYAVQVARSVAAGKLDLVIDNRSSHPDSLLASMQHMVESLTGDMRRIDLESRQIGQSSFQIADISQRITSSSREQEHHAVEVRAATSELAATSQSVMQLSQTVSDRASEARSRASEGVQAIRGNIDEMARAVSDVQAAGEQINALGDASRQIQAITETISGITEQTNLLALNAAIEAARAGEAGRGFAVVAEEVRNLAKRAGEATATINGIIGNLTDLVADNTRSMEGIIQRTHQGMAKAEGASEVFGLILQDIEYNASLASEISAVSGQQMDKLGQLETRLDDLLTTQEENTRQIHTTGVVSADLHQVSERLRKVMQHFQFDARQLASAAPSDKRSAPRIAQNLMVRVSDGREEQIATSTDFSMSGIRLKVARALEAKVGDLLDLQIRQPSDDRQAYNAQRPFAVKARVQRQSREGDSFSYGLKFEEPSADTQKKLEACIRYYNHAPFYGEA